MAKHVHLSDRRKEISPPRVIEPWIRYNFPGRGDIHSSFKWNSDHFNGTDWDQRGQRNAIFKIVNPPEAPERPGSSSTGSVAKGWAADVDDENGNADYLMFSNVDYLHPDVREDVTNWGKWMVSDTVGVDGFRLDAVQHYSWKFAQEWIEHVRHTGLRKGRDIFCVGEFWVDDVVKLLQWLINVHHLASLFDTPLVYHFSKVSQAWDKAWDMIGQGGRLSTRGIELNKVFQQTLVENAPENAVVSTS